MFRRYLWQGFDQHLVNGGQARLFDAFGGTYDDTLGIDVGRRGSKDFTDYMAGGNPEYDRFFRYALL